jgi:hypothetical protein
MVAVVGEDMWTLPVWIQGLVCERVFAEVTESVEGHSVVAGRSLNRKE